MNEKQKNNLIQFDILRSGKKILFLLILSVILFSLMPISFGSFFQNRVYGAEITIVEIPRSHFSLSTDSQQTDKYPVNYATDGNISTFWHTNTVSPTPHPHHLTIDLGSSYLVRGLRYLPRQDGNTGGVITGYEIYVSEDNLTWGTAVTSGTFASNANEKEVTFSGKIGRYVKFVSLSNIKGNGSAGAAEMKVLGLDSDSTPIADPIPPSALIVYNAGSGVPNLPGPEISVGVWNYTRDGSKADPFEIEANESYVIKDRNGKLLATLPGTSVTKVKYNTDGNLRVYNSIPEKILDKEVTFEPAKAGSSSIIFNAHRPGSTYDEYRGKIKVRYGDTSKLIWIINILPLEHYIWGIGEITGTGDEDYNRTMTTAFRTYGYWKILYSTKYALDGFKVDATSASQIYRGYEWEVAYPRIKAAAIYTQGKIAKYGSDIALTPFSSWTDGRTRSFDERWGSKEYPWCQSVPDPYGRHPTMTTSQLIAAGNHMVGISAHGALNLATNYNWAWDRILKYYLTGITIVKIY